MEETAIYTVLTEVFRDVFMKDDMVLTPEMSGKTVTGWNSLKHIELILYTEQRLDLKFTTQELDNLRQVGDLVRLIQLKTAT